MRPGGKCDNVVCLSRIGGGGEWGHCEFEYDDCVGCGDVARKGQVSGDFGIHGRSGECGGSVDCGGVCGACDVERTVSLAGSVVVGGVCGELDVVADEHAQVELERDGGEDRCVGLVFGCCCGDFAADSHLVRRTCGHAVGFA